MINISMQNDDAVDLFLTVKDLNSANQKIVVGGAPDGPPRLHAGDYVHNVAIQEDDNGWGKIEWTARRPDGGTETGTEDHLGGGAIVKFRGP
jgi:hypothetical protein